MNKKSGLQNSGTAANSRGSKDRARAGRAQYCGGLGRHEVTRVDCDYRLRACQGDDRIWKIHESFETLLAKFSTVFGRKCQDASGKSGYRKYYVNDMRMKTK